MTNHYESGDVRDRPIMWVIESIKVVINAKKTSKAILLQAKCTIKNIIAGDTETTGNTKLTIYIKAIILGGNALICVI